jgi:oligoribonuclease NrnB/cAMP/cGMP phosphodiesterase (DHH superfamily)
MICIYHSVDLDGWCSAAIVKYWYQKQSFRSDQLQLIGWTYGNKIPDIPKNEEVIMVDISFSSEEMKKLIENNNLEWCDHHISAINEMNNAELNPHGLRDIKFAACELTWKYFFGENIPEFVRLLGRYDCFGHKGTDEEQKVLEFQYAARAYFKNPDDCLEMLRFENGEGVIDSIKTVPSLLNIGKGIYQYLCTEAIQEYKNIWPLEIGGFKFATINKQRFNPINFGINYHEDGYDGFACYWFANNKWNFSLYNDNGKVDCSEVCKKLGGGGHKGAAGFTCDTWCDHLGVLNVYTKPK